MKNPRPMRDAASRLTDKEYRFIRKEFGITKKELLHLSEDLLIELYDELKNARNKNVLIVGGSGSGKTRFWLKPNLLQCHSSYVVTDPNGYTVRG